MSESKKVIHVKDLIIKADNVHFEPTQQRTERERPRPFDAFFGVRRRADEHVEPEQKLEAEEAEEVEEETDEKEEPRSERRPFSWL
ncbi:hypothetical protein [Paraliobacillus salinarum]|uniref:hypothetical protein n=1 Tax=Paraliobacillus salinarum TaxID=1158996 RepID=UPI0015F65D4D|nr:hypothetical protein [Paraliobacillus salinarum]